MGRKGKTQKYTAKEVANKHKLAKEALGSANGAGEGLKKRNISKKKNDIQCKICLSSQPNMTSMKIHYDSKHSKINFEEEEKKYID